MAGTRTVPDGLVGPECSPSRFLMSRVSAKKQSSTCVRVYRVTSLIRIRTPLGDPTVGLCLGSWGVPRGVGVVVWASSGRVTPAGFGRRDCRRKHAPSPSASPPARPLSQHIVCQQRVRRIHPLSFEENTTQILGSTGLSN